MKREAMHEAWGLIHHYNYTKRDALKQGWLLAKVHHLMRERESLTFEFLKTDGKTIRKAQGTLHPNIIPRVQGVRVPPETTQVFFDLEKNEWRSFRKSNLTRIIL